MWTTRKKRPLMVYFGHHKCASTYIRDIIISICQLLHLKVLTEYVPSKLPYRYHLEKKFLQKRRRTLTRWKKAIGSSSGYDFLMHRNADRVILDTLKGADFRGFHVIRDPRDIVVSGYFSHKYSHSVSPETNPFMWNLKKRIQGINIEEGLMEELEFCSVYFERLSEWDYSLPHIYETRFEKLVRQPYQELFRIFSFLGISLCDQNIFEKLSVSANKTARTHFRFWPFVSCLKLSPNRLQKIIDDNSFQKKSGRKIGKPDHHSRLRKGIIGDWKDYFTPSVKSEFKCRYGELLIRLNYEKSCDW